MKASIIIAAALSLASSMAVAQTTNSVDADTPAIATPESTNADAPVPGENSFTEDQARERITEAGYSNVEALALDAQGIWRGTAKKDAQTVAVALDYQGNIVAH
ncbi:hypothetical protein DEM27_23370 [Metarhizobium album]|uniref:PepSY domain-containing protein n=1 Tax=Metarhizobium album TaxID=2182425 RepID=A0A2U2DKP4_9HYPH|nr:hypothetical protein [Rhizobium album]PWE53863.1 hypothetical protein DEM27_23370 [Rhizobium album]